MADTHGHIRFLCDQLAVAGANFSYEEVEEILRLFKDVTLKLIVTNVPRAIYDYGPAKDAFENLFKAFDPDASFLYLPSFSRAQVFMTKAEAALCARLQTQGWRLPETLLPSVSRNSPDDGIRCYIDQMDDDMLAADEPDEVPSFLDEDVPCTCGYDDLPVERDRQATENDAVSEGEQSLASIGRVEKKLSFESTGAQSVVSGAERKLTSPERENTSEASGDDGVSSSPLHCSHSSCPKHGSRNRRMKHLAPPKPPRLFLLSPPASPPVGWAPKPECQPVINYELLEALASLAPGEAFELHPQDPAHAHPSIVITPCEPQSSGPRPHIIQTRCPERK